MKKIFICAILVLGMIFTRQIISVNASESYASGGNIEGQTIQVTKNGMYNVTSGTLTLSDVIFEDGTDDAITNVITVGKDATLVLNNVNFSQLSGSCAIILNGKMIANNVHFGTMFTSAVELNSTKENPCVLGGDIFLNKISIDDGYITLNEDVNLKSITKIQLENAFVGKRVVTGNNTYASYYLSKFQFLDGVVFDYVGDDYSSYAEDLKSSDALSAGDIISTSKYAKFNSDGVVYLANKYCTGIKYIMENDEISCIVSGGTLMNFPVNNINCLMSQNYTEPSEYLYNTATANIKIKCNDTQIGTTRQITFPYGISWSEFVDIPDGYEFISIEDSVDGDGVSVSSAFNNSKFAKCIISTSTTSNNYTFDVIVNVKEKVIMTYVDVELENYSLEYMSENLINNIKPYYMFGGDKYYLTFDVSLGGENVTAVENVGDYIITITESAPENISFNNTTLLFKVLPCEISVNYTNTIYRYDGNDKSLTAELVGVMPGDSVNLTLDNNLGKDVGEYIVTAEIDNENYVLNDNSRSCVLVINKGVYDVGDITALSTTFVYTGLKIDFKLDDSNVPSFVDYEFDVDDCILPGDYDVEVTFTISPNDCYDELSQTLKSFSVVITKAVLDINDYITLSDATFIYDFKYHSINYVGDLPDKVLIDTVENNNQINAGEYEVKYHFKSEFYEIDDTLTAKMSILAVKLDIVLISNVYAYTGENIIPNITFGGICDGDNCTVVPMGNINVGEYDLVVNVSNSNYYVDTTNIKYNIVPKRIDLSNLTLDKSEIVYSGIAYIPSLIGDIPNEVDKFDLVYSEIKNVGEYVVTADIEVGSNYTYDLWSKTIKVLPKSITITFGNYDNFYYTGSVKSVNVTLNNLVENDFDKYLVNYSKTPIEVGNYTCTVMLMENTNYVIVGSNSISFRIYPNEKVVTNDDMSVTVQGMNGNISDLVVTCTTKDSKVEDSLKSLSARINGYNVINLTGVEEDVTVKLTTNLNIKNKDKIKVFKLDNGKLLEVDFDLNNKVITFEGNSKFQYVIIEESNNTTLIVIISILSVVAVSLSVIVVILVKRKKLKK